MISRQRRKIVIFNVKELKVENPCGISFRGIGLHIIHDVEIFNALVFLRTLSNHKLWECACPYSLHRSAPREGFEYVQSSRQRRPDQPQRCLSLPPSAVLQKKQILLREPFYPALQKVSLQLRCDQSTSQGRVSKADQERDPRGELAKWFQSRT